MTTSKISLSPSILLAVLIGLLALVLAGIMAVYLLARWTPPAPLAPEIPRIKSAPPTAAVGTGMSALLSAPPFWASRRPEPTSPPQPHPKEEEPETLPKDTQLLGLYGSGQDAGALIRIGGKTKRIPKGGKVVGWTVQDIQPGRVVLTTPRGQHKVIPLLHAKPAVGSTSPPRHTPPLPPMMQHTGTTPGVPPPTPQGPESQP